MQPHRPILKHFLCDEQQNLSVDELSRRDPGDRSHASQGIGKSPRARMLAATSRTSSNVPRTSESPNFSSTIQYVFIDESQRDSKRLKITRACESCRRRKVKCDSPHMVPGEACSSCKRLQIDCVLQQQTNQDYEERSGDSGEEEYDTMPRTTSALSFDTSMDSRAFTISSPKSTQRPRERRRSSNLARPSITTRESGDTVQRHQPAYPRVEFTGVDSLTRIFGDLNIEFGGRASFVNDAPFLPIIGQSRKLTNNDFNLAILAEEPAYLIPYAAIEAYLPPEELALMLLESFFRDIHPYMPILDKVNFMQTWQSTKRSTLSPYLLLSLFACSAAYRQDLQYFGTQLHPTTDYALQLMDVILRYRESFRDAPRLSTLQAEILNLKFLESRSSVPGYFYKSWFQLSSVIRMGRDLKLHRAATAQSADRLTISAKRIWQTSLIMDQMMGSAQGRDMQLDMAEIDLTLLAEADQQAHGLDLQQLRVHNSFIHLVGLIKILRRCTEVHTISGIKFPFSAEPQYPALARILVQWYTNLPSDLQLNPKKIEALPSHFIGHLHLTYSMITCVLHRPWVVSTGDYGKTGEWREHLRMCNEAARRAVALYELMLAQYGDSGICWMIRGNNFAIYGAVIMTMIHTVCLTCPEEEFNQGARGFFDRSTKILDRLSAISSTPQLQTQIANLKGIFGANTSPSAMKFDPQTLTPELASMQMQYRHMQNEKARQRQKSISPSLNRQATNMYPAQFYSALPSSDTLYVPNSANDFIALGIDTGELSSTSESFSHTPSSIADWNPASLMGAFNQTFPLPGSGLLDTNHLPYFTDDLALTEGNGYQTTHSLHQQRRASMQGSETIYYQNQSKHPGNTF